MYLMTQGEPLKVKVQEYDSEMNDIINSENVDINTEGINADMRR